MPLAARSGGVGHACGRRPVARVPSGRGVWPLRRRPPSAARRWIRRALGRLALQCRLPCRWSRRSGSQSGRRRVLSEATPYWGGMATGWDGRKFARAGSLRRPGAAPCHRRPARPLSGTSSDAAILCSEDCPGKLE